MLARLLEIECVADVAVDRSGAYLRLGVRGSPAGECVERVSAWLEREGVFVERADNEIQPERWYGPDQVRELSRAEAEELGARAVERIDPATDDAVKLQLCALVPDHLHDAFVTHHLERGERCRCVPR